MTDDALAFGPALLRVSTLVSDEYARIAEREGVTLAEARLLFVLAVRPTNMLGLGSVLRARKSTMTGVVARMVRSGLVDRGPDPADRRHLLVTPTARGAEIAAVIQRELRAWVGDLVVGLPPAERDRLAAALSSIAARADRDPGG
ncbi:MarR family transcriptional regulator [Galbitalea sp. SE-J8]|uniref:MarR family winged helix-turn-helix transcriptional regulator n=1 Tax=Galbitalea sp. SE-J8 TaxID=3054952 RepID=UPI00259CE159|nr:MarR family transcriptional regulator [Galbitalea sp. SE-J8]MDM4764057.1 MarR family transcriptional regulator [Galbitalea sp. SE-J8]